MLRPAIALLAVLVLSAAPAGAHNTAAAAAGQVTGIVVDGDLADWPPDLPAYRIDGEHAASRPVDADDLTASFRVAWDEAAQALFVAVEAADSSPVVVDTATAWNASDGSEVFLDLAHAARGSSTVQHVLYGVHHEVFASGADSSDPGLARYAVRRTAGGHTYEWRFDLAAIAKGRVRAVPGMVLGLDVAVADRDEDGSFSWVAWGPGIGKSGSSHRLGDVVLLPSTAAAARADGTVRWKKKGQGLPPRRVRITPEDGDGTRFGLVVAADTAGHWEAVLAPGVWRFEPVDLRIRLDHHVQRRERLQAGQARRLRDLAVPVERDRGRLVDQLFADLAPGRPGAAVLVAQDGRILHEGAYGLAQVELGVPITPRTKFRIASVSKQFTATAVMMLVESGQVDLDAPLSNYLPDYPHAGQITTRQLLAHVSGIPNYLSMDEFWAQAAIGRDMAGLLDVFQHLELAFEPGSRYSYSNSGYVVLAHLLEVVSGQTYADFLQERIFDPVGMTDSGVDHYRPIIVDRAAGYSLSSEGELVNTSWLDMYLLTGAGNLYSTVGDLYRWGEARFSGTLLSRAALDEMFTKVKLSDGNEIDYGLGYRIGELHGLREVGHSGSINGFTSQFNRYPDENFTVIVLDNSPWIAPGEVARQIAEIYLADRMTWSVASSAD